MTCENCEDYGLTSPDGQGIPCWVCGKVGEPIVIEDLPCDDCDEEAD